MDGNGMEVDSSGKIGTVVKDEEVDTKVARDGVTRSESGRRGVVARDGSRRRADEAAGTVAKAGRAAPGETEAQVAVVEAKDSNDGATREGPAPLGGSHTGSRQRMRQHTKGIAEGERAQQRTGSRADSQWM